MSERPAVYLETTIPSFLTSRPSSNLVVAGKQEVTRQWWETQRSRFNLVISQFVLDEASFGDEEAATRRIEALACVDLLEIDREVLTLAGRIVETGLLPPRAKTDAAHIAVAARHSVEYLLTWNCTHIANAEILIRLNFIVSQAGFFLPTVCTPDELFGGGQFEQ